jgi:hypothetical protein
MPRYTIFLLAQLDDEPGGIGILAREERHFGGEAEAIQRAQEMCRSHTSSAIGFRVYDDVGHSIHKWMAE